MVVKVSRALVRSWIFSPFNIFPRLWVPWLSKHLWPHRELKGFGEVKCLGNVIYTLYFLLPWKLDLDLIVIVFAMQRLEHSKPQSLPCGNWHMVTINFVLWPCIYAVSWVQLNYDVVVQFIVIPHNIILFTRGKAIGLSICMLSSSARKSPESDLEF